jgi:hypothetical protein
MESDIKNLESLLAEMQKTADVLDIVIKDLQDREENSLLVGSNMLIGIIGRVFQHQIDIINYVNSCMKTCKKERGI